MRRCGESVHYLKKLKSQMESIVNDDYQYKLEHEVGKRKLIVHTDRIDDEKLETISAIIDNEALKNIEVVQYNQSIDIPWRDWTIGFTQIECIDTNGTQRVSNTGIKMASDSRLEMKLRNETVDSYKQFTHSWETPAIYVWQLYTDVWKYRYNNIDDWPMYYNTPPKGEIFTIVTEGPKFYFNGVLKADYKDDSVFEAAENLSLFASKQGYWGITIGAYHIRISRAGIPQRNFIPALDPIGAPCLFDTVTRTPYYCDGSQDFLCPGNEEEPTTYSLRRPITYGQLTENGLRRLYHVPVNYKGTKEEYAAKFGFKPIAETDCPEEGKYVSQWKENENEIILEWIEIENPEELSIE